MRPALLAAAVLLISGGLLHPMIPAGDPSEVLEGRRWQAAHWLLSVGQAVAAAALASLRPRLVGARLAGLGFTVGLLGTLSAATALPTSEYSGAVAAWTLGLGRACMLLVGLGAIVWALEERRSSLWRPGWRPALLALGAAAVAAAALPADRPWFHDIVLRAGALAAGGVLGALPIEAPDGKGT